MVLIATQQPNGQYSISPSISPQIVQLSQSPQPQLSMAAMAQMQQIQQMQQMKQIQAIHNTTQNALTMFCDVCDDKSFDLVMLRIILIQHSRPNNIFNTFSLSYLALFNAFLVKNVYSS